MLLYLTVSHFIKQYISLFATERDCNQRCIPNYASVNGTGKHCAVLLPTVVLIVLMKILKKTDLKVYYFEMHIWSQNLDLSWLSPNASPREKVHDSIVWFIISRAFVYLLLRFEYKLTNICHIYLWSKDRLFSTFKMKIKAFLELS